MKSLERHKSAYRFLRGLPRSVLKSVADISPGYPIDLRGLGLLQMLAFSLGKGELGHRNMAQALATWLLSKESGAPLGEEPEASRSARLLLGKLAEASRAAYLAADLEAVAYADALKLIATALEKTEEPNG
jgi:hypothetical protein